MAIKQIAGVFFLLVIIVTMAMVNGCKKDDPASPDPGNPQELITTVILSLTDSVSSSVVTAQYRDLDGAGGNPPTIDSLHLSPDRVYIGTIGVLDETKTPPDTVTTEIEEEANHHQFFYDFHDGLETRVTITRTDFDTNVPPLPVGLQFRVATTAGVAAVGHLHIVLSHYEGTKTAAPSSESDIDIEVGASVR
jgi:hypothetical protein